MTNEDIEAMHEREHPNVSDPDVQEALSRRYSDAAVTLVRLRSGKFAVFNAIKEFCGIASAIDGWPPACWRPPEAPPKPVSIDLDELGLL